MQKWPRDEPLFNKFQNFKKSTVIALANDTLDGPLCDTLLPLVSLCKVEKQIGRWHVCGRVCLVVWLHAYTMYAFGGWCEHARRNRAQFA